MSQQSQRLFARGCFVNGEAGLAQNLGPAVAARRVIVDIQHQRYGVGPGIGRLAHLGSLIHCHAGRLPSLLETPSCATRASKPHSSLVLLLYTIAAAVSRRLRCSSSPSGKEVCTTTAMELVRGSAFSALRTSKPLIPGMERSRKIN